MILVMPAIISTDEWAGIVLLIMGTAELFRNGLKHKYNRNNLFTHNLIDIVKNVTNTS